MNDQKIKNANNKWHFNLDEVKCPECGAKQPTLRKPENLNQLMFGGWTCENCACKMDKFGHKIVEEET